jgi:hypothetical protein
MATFHISREEAVKDIDGLIARASNGDKIVIEENYSPVAVLQSPAKPEGRLLSETLDGEFEKDVSEFINAHHEPLRDFWD